MQGCFDDLVKVREGVEHTGPALLALCVEKAHLLSRRHGNAYRVKRSRYVAAVSLGQAS